MNFSLASFTRSAWLVLLLGIGLAGCDRTPAVIKIGVAQPLTGPIAALGQDLLNGVKLAVEEINKDGFRIQGKPVTLELVVVDDHSNPETGKAVAQQLVDAGVLGVIGHLNSGVSIPAAPIYAKAHIAELAISTNPKFTEQGLPTTLRLVANDTLQAKAIGSFAASHFGNSKYAVLDDGTQYGKDLAAGAVANLKSNGKEIALQKSFDDKTTQFDELANAIKAADVGVIVSTLNDFQLLALLETLKKINYTKVKVLGGDTIKTPLLLKGEATGIAIYASSPIVELTEFGPGKAYHSKYLEKFKVEPAYASHYTYDAMYVLAAAIRRAPSLHPEDITETLRNIDGYAPVTGSMKWDAKGEQRYGVIGIYKVEAGTWQIEMRSDVW